MDAFAEYSWQNSRCDEWWNSKTIKLIQQQDVCRLMHDRLPYIFRKMIWLQPVQLPLRCWWWITRVPEIVIYLSMYLCASFHRSSANAYAHGTHSYTGPPWTSRLYSCKQTCFDSSAWFSMAVKLVGHLQMVEFNVVLLRPKGEFKWTPSKPFCLYGLCSHASRRQQR